MHQQIHVRFHTNRLFICPDRHGHGFLPREAHRSLDVHGLRLSVTIEVQTQIEVFPIQLMKGAWNFERKPHDLIGNQLPFQNRPRFGSIVTNTCHISQIITVGGSLVTGIGIVKHGDHDAVLFFCSRDLRNVHERLILDLVNDAFGDTPPVFPLISRLIGKIDARLLDHDRRNLPEPRTAPTRDQTCNQYGSQYGESDHIFSCFSVLTRRCKLLFTVP